MAYFGKQFTLEKQENFEELVNTFDLPQEKKDRLISTKASTKILRDGDIYTLIYTSVGGEPKEVVFKNGDVIEETVHEGITTKSTFTVDGNTITQTLRAPNDMEVVYKREYSDNELIVTITSSKFNGTAKRYYKA